MVNKTESHNLNFVIMFSTPSPQARVIQTPATTEEHVRSVRPTGATPSLVTSANVHQASVEFTANTVSYAAFFPVSLTWDEIKKYIRF